MNIFGNDLYFLRRDTSSNIHSAVARVQDGMWVTACGQTFPTDALDRNLVARRASQLPGPQKFCKRCAQHFAKLNRVHEGEPVKDV